MQGCKIAKHARGFPQGRRAKTSLLLGIWTQKKYDNNVAFPKNAEKYNNNVAFPKGRLWRAHCVNNSEERKTAKARKGLKPLVIRIYSSILCGLLRFTRPPCASYGDDDNKEFKNFDNKGF